MGQQVFSTGRVKFKEDLLEYITEECERTGVDWLEAVEESLEVIGYLARNAYRRDDAIKQLYEQAKRDAKQELLNKLQ